MEEVVVFEGSFLAMIFLRYGIELMGDQEAIYIS